MEIDQLCSVYDLVTKLCERLVNFSGRKLTKKYLKRLRSKSYEILLSKQIPASFYSVTEILENNKDPFCHVLAWEFVLINEYNSPDRARKIQKCVETLQKSSSMDGDVFSGVLYVLLQLRKPPDLDAGFSEQTVASTDGCIKFRRFDDFSFRLNSPMICNEAQFRNSSFSMRPVPKLMPLPLLSENCNDCMRIPSRTSCDSKYSFKEEKESYDTDLVKSMIVADNPDIWDLVSNSVFTEHRTWETLGNPCPEPERPFLTESSSSVCSSFYDLRKCHVAGFLTSFTVLSTKNIEQGTFIKHIKFLLVGMTSESFKLNAKNELYLIDGISIEGISQRALEKYAKDLIFCGSCYKALNNLCNVSTQCYGNEHKGFIFKEFCDSIKRYLSYYRVATLSLSEDTNLIKVHNHIRPLHEHLDCLASICKVGPYTESSELPSGVALLNYLYEKLVNLTRRDVVMVLYSIFYPCIQVYFSRFLQQWIFSGTVNDPYNEFFIHNSKKFMRARSRSYWTKCYIVQVDIVPDFLMELASDILYCGKAMNLLKLCTPSSSLSSYVTSKKPLISCRLNSEQIAALEQESTCYYLEARSECAANFSVRNFLTRILEDKLIIADLATAKRAATIKRLELEKLKKANRDFEEKRKVVAALKSDYDKALQDKKNAIIGEVKRELTYNESMLKVHNLRRKIVEEEALKLIDYYDTLMEISENKRLSIEKHIDRLKKTDLQLDVPRETYVNVKPMESLSMFYSTTELSRNVQEDSEEIVEVIQETARTFESASDSSFHSATSESVLTKEDEIFPYVKLPESVASCVCLDIVNANSPSDTSDNCNTVNNRNRLLAKMVLENKEAALRNKQKVMCVEMGMRREIYPNENCHGEPKMEQKPLSELQKNRLKVMSSEFGLTLKISRQPVDNQNYLNENNNIINIDNSESRDNDNILNNNNDDANHNNITNNKNHNLKLDFSRIPTNEPPSNTSIFSRFWNSPNFELGKPMSIDSTPCTGFSNTISEKDFSYSHPLSTAISSATEDIFSFSRDANSMKTLAGNESALLLKRIPLPDVETLSTDCIKLFVQQSVSIPANVQTKLVNNELLKYFLVELEYLPHLNSLRNYFFLLDGEFGRNITEGLFEKLYDVNFPVDLINFRTLQNLVYHALDSSIKSQKDFGHLSFKINNLPKKFDLGNPDVLDCLSLTYRVNWPLNILLPSDVIAKYDEVFKFLLKLNRVSWVLKKIFQELKLLSKESGRKAPFLILSPEFNRIHYCRHVMTHFMQTLQNYIVGEVLQPSWSTFEKNLTSVNDLNDLYNLHNCYVKDILFMCLLNKRFAPIRKVIQNIFVVILKFHHYLSVQDWLFDEDLCTFTHPNFRKLLGIFSNFQEFVVYVFKAGRKVAKVGYQPHLVQLLDLLDVNGYYRRSTNET